MDKQGLSPIKNNLLYYPYINLPENAWLTRMLLYYDQIGTITPPTYRRNPSKFMPSTLDLIKENLVIQVFPSQYVSNIEGFAESFEEYIESLGSALVSRRKSFRNKEKFLRPNRMRIHVSKMYSLCDYLVRNRIATKDDNEWYDVEYSTALDFMSYLAAMIGQVDESGFVPVTDKTFPLNRLVKSVSHDARIEDKTSEVRTQLLTNLFPAPTQRLKAVDILHFKEKHDDKLSVFRHYVETTIIDILNIKDSDLREERVARFNTKAQEDIEEIISAMREHGWVITGFAHFYGLLSEIPVIGIPLRIVQRVYKASTDSYSTNIKMVKETPLLYAAVAQKELLKSEV